MIGHIIPQRVIDAAPAVITHSIIYVGEPASVVYERHEVRRARQLRDVARDLRKRGAKDNANAALRMAAQIIRNLRTCNESIPRHRRIASLGWKGPVW